MDAFNRRSFICDAESMGASEDRSTRYSSGLNMHTVENVCTGLDMSDFQHETRLDMTLLTVGFRQEANESIGSKYTSFSTGVSSAFGVL